MEDSESTSGQLTIMERTSSMVEKEGEGSTMKRKNTNFRLLGKQNPFFWLQYIIYATILFYWLWNSLWHNNMNTFVCVIMAPPAAVSIEHAVAVLKRYMIYLSTDNFPPYSSDVWKNMSKDLGGKWTPNHVYHSVKYNRRNILTQARKEAGLEISLTESVTDITENSRGSSSQSTSESDSEEGSKHSKTSSFDLILSSEEWNEVKPEDKSKQREDAKHQSTPIRRREKLKPGIWTNVLAIAFAKQTKLPCAFTFKQAYVSTSKQSKYYLSVKGKCKLKSCGNIFEGYLEKKPNEHEGCTIKVKTRDTRDENHEQVKRPLNGKHRQNVQRELVAEGCNNWQKRQARENMNIEDEEPPYIYSNDVLHQAKKQRVDRDIGVDPLDRRDLIRAIEDILARAEFKGLVAAVGSTPFYVFYSTPNQLHVYKKYAQIMKSGTSIKIDATGSVVRKIKLPNGTTTGHLFLYTIVINFEQKTVPIYQMLSESHVTEFIEYWLKQWLRKGAPRPREVICDYSKALLSAICMAFNNQTLKAYVNDCFLKISEDKPVQVITRIRVDVAHLIHFVSRWKCFANCRHTEVKEFYIRCVARMVESTTLAQFEEIFTLTCAVASQKYEDSELDLSFAKSTVAARRKVEAFIAVPTHQEKEDSREKSCHMRPDSVESEITDPDEEESSESNSVGRWIDRCISNAAGTRCPGTQINAFYMPEFVTSITRLAREFPLWTAVAAPYRAPRASSACVESYFNLLKNNVLKEKMYRADAFLLIHLRDIDGGCMIFNSKLTQFERNDRKLKEDLVPEEPKLVANDRIFDDSDLMTVENWGGKGRENEEINVNFSYKSEDEDFKAVEDKYITSTRHDSFLDHSYCRKEEVDGLDQRTSNTQTKNDIDIGDTVACPSPILHEESDVLPPLEMTIPDLCVQVEYDKPIITASFHGDTMDDFLNNNNIFAVAPVSSTETKPTELIHGDAVPVKTETTKKESKYFPTYPEIRLINSRVGKNRPKASLLRNGNCFSSPVNVRGKACFLRNTCAFDSLIHVVMTAAIDDPNYAAIIDKSKNTTFQFISRLLQNGVTKKTYEERGVLLERHFAPVLSASISNRIETYTIDAHSSIAEMTKHTMQSAPSLRRIERCSHCAGRETTCTVLPVNHKTILKEGFGTMQKALDLSPCIHGIKCRDRCPGKYILYSQVNFHVFVELDVRNNVKQKSGMPCKLRQVAPALKIQKEDGSNDEYRLVGIVAYISGHFVSYCLRTSGKWQLYDDLKLKATPKSMDMEMEPHLAVYVRQHNLA